MTRAEGQASARWRFCPACRSYRYTWKPSTRQGECQDCGHQEGEPNETQT
jgi:hypothetical protein